MMTTICCAARARDTVRDVEKARPHHRRREGVREEVVAYATKEDSRWGENLSHGS